MIEGVKGIPLNLDQLDNQGCPNLEKNSQLLLMFIVDNKYQCFTNCVTDIKINLRKARIKVYHDSDVEA